MSNGAEGIFRKIILFALKLGTASALVWWLIAGNLEGLKEVFREFSCVFLFPALAGYFIHMLLSAWRWYILARALGFALSPMQAVSLTFQGYFFALLIPAGAIGGDFARIAFLAHASPAGTRRDGAVTVLADRMVGMAALFLLAIVLILLNFGRLMETPLPDDPGLEEFRQWAVALMFFICAAGLTAVVLLFCHRQLRRLPGGEKLFRASDKLTGGILGRLTKAADVYRSKWKVLLTAFVVSIFGVHLMLAAGVWLMTFGIAGAHIPLPETASAVTVGNIAGLLPSFSGIGFRDVTMEMLLAGSCSQGAAAAVPLCFTAVILLGNLSGGLFFVFDALLQREGNKI